MTNFRLTTIPRNGILTAKILFSMDLIYIVLAIVFLEFSSFYLIREKMGQSLFYFYLLPLFVQIFPWFFDVVDVKYIPNYGWKGTFHLFFYIPYLIIIVVPMIHIIFNLLNARKKVKERYKKDISIFTLGLFFIIFAGMLFEGIFFIFFDWPSLISIILMVGFSITSIPFLRSKG
jgi:hypothetical protein